MADDPKDPPATGDPDPKNDPPGDLGDAGKKALEAERKARRDAEKQLKDIQTKLKELEDKDKSEATKLAERAATAEARAAAAELRSLQAEVGHGRGLPPGSWTRLQGTTKEELEADAEDLLASFKPAGAGENGGSANGGGAKPPAKPTEKLHGGGDPTSGAEPTRDDIRKIVEGIPRGF